MSPMLTTRPSVRRGRRDIKSWGRDTDDRAVTRAGGAEDYGHRRQTAHAAYHSADESPEWRRDYDVQPWNPVPPPGDTRRPDARARRSERIAGIPTRLTTVEPADPDALARPNAQVGKGIAILRLA